MPRPVTAIQPRNPRHPAAEESGVRIEILRSAVASTFGAELVNLSRNGFQLRTTAPLARGESITLQMRDPQTGFQTSLPATVKWRRAADDGWWSYGGTFTETVDWETLGELFLNKILDADGHGC